MKGGVIHGNQMCTKFECYQKLFPARKLTWIEAERTCQSHGGHLVTINSFEELYLVRMLLAGEMPLTLDSLYIGLQQLLVSCEIWCSLTITPPPIWWASLVSGKINYK